MNNEDPYDYTVFLESELWWMGMTRKAFGPWGFGVSSVMIPEGYAMKFSNQESLEGDKQETLVALLSSPDSKFGSGRCQNLNDMKDAYSIAFYKVAPAEGMWVQAISIQGGSTTFEISEGVTVSESSELSVTNHVGIGITY